MKEVECGIIRDLLPLYEDNAVSEETAQMVREHLKDCPECREELRKMRTPISLPSEEDGELLEWYRQRQAKLRRRRNIKIGCVLSALGLTVLFCLWYVRPQTFSGLSGGQQDIYSLSAHLIQFSIEHSNGNSRGVIDVWELDWQETGDPAAEEILDALSERTYRAKLSNFLLYIPVLSDNVYGSSGIEGDIILRLDDRDGRWATFFLNDLGNVKAALPGKGPELEYQTDPALFQKLASIVREYGTFQED